MIKFTVKTGFGFFRDSAGNVIAHANLPAGDHPIRDGFTYHEVEDAAAIAQVIIYEAPKDKERRENEAKVQAEIRRAAIAQLKQTGDIPQDYE